MRDEIRQQPEVLQRILDEGWPEIRQTAAALREQDIRSVFIAARGTSDNAALYAKYLFEVLLGVPVSLASPSAFTLYDSQMSLNGVLAIGISQSGESKDVLQTVRRAGELGASTLSITNDSASSLASEASWHFDLRAGAEESVAATKTYTAELLVLYLLVRALQGERTPKEDALKLPQSCSDILGLSWEGTQRYRYAEYMVATSRGYNLATANEAALKLMETTYIVAQPFSAADLRHGPFAMIDRGFPVLAIVPPGPPRQGMVEIVGALAERGAELLVIGDPEACQRSAACFAVPEAILNGVPEELSPILYAIPAQLLAHELALLKKTDPDAPRGLSKVTQTW